MTGRLLVHRLRTRNQRKWVSTERTPGEGAYESVGEFVLPRGRFYVQRCSLFLYEDVPTSTKESVLETLLTKIQKFVVLALAAMLAIVVVLSTLHLGVLIAQEAWKPPRFLIAVQGLLEIFGYFLLVLIGVELLRH